MLFIQHDELTALDTGMAIVLPLTTQGRPTMRHFRVHIAPRERLLKDSYVVVDEPRTIDRMSLGEGPLATLTRTEMSTVERGLLTALGIIYGIPPAPGQRRHKTSVKSTRRQPLPKAVSSLSSPSLLSRHTEQGQRHTIPSVVHRARPRVEPGLGTSRHKPEAPLLHID